MKKYFVLALALVVFAVAPVMADAKVSGEFRYSALWESGDELYSGNLDRVRLVFGSQVDDFNYFEARVNRAAVTDGDVLADDAVQYNYATISTDWGKYFGFADQGFGLTTTVGSDEFGNFDELSYTIYDAGGFEPVIADRAAMKVDMDIMGIVMPYVATTFQAFDSAQGADVAEYILGAGVTFAPVWAEVYFGQNGLNENDKFFGVEAEYASEVADGVDLKVGGALHMTNPADEWTWAYLFGAGVGAYGAQVDFALTGSDAYTALDALAVSGKYDILKWLGVQAGMQMAFSDYKEAKANDEGFLGAEFGLYVKPGAAKYGLGYIVANEDAGAYSAHDGMKATVAPKGGMYFTANLKY